MPGLLGETFAVLSALSFALSNIFILRTSRSRGDKGVLFSVVVTIAFSLGLFLLLEAGQTRLTGSAEEIAGLGWFALAGLSAMVFGRTLVFESIRRLGVARASAVKRLNPFFSVVLAALFLSEAISGADLAGMAAIALAFGLMIRESMSRARDAAQPGGLGAYAFGAGAAFAYAVSYVARKLGLFEFDAPALGTFVSAVSGFLVFALMAALSTAYRPMFTGMFRDIDRWIVMSAVMISMGQILMFAALAHEELSTVVMISSLEVFLAILLSSFVFRIESRPGAPVLAAAALATAGVVLVAAG